MHGVTCEIKNRNVNKDKKRSGVNSQKTNYRGRMTAVYNEEEIEKEEEIELFEEKKVYDVKQVAEVLGKSDQWIYDLINTNSIPVTVVPRKQNSTYLFLGGRLNKWLKKQSFD
jgi:hypothetical protein